MGASFSSITSWKKSPANKYNNVAPIVVDTSTINIPHHLPKTNPENNKIGVTKPRSKVQIAEKIKNAIDKNKKFSFLYSKIMSWFYLMNSKLVKSLISIMENKKYKPIIIIVK